MMAAIKPSWRIAFVALLVVSVILSWTTPTAADDTVCGWVIVTVLGTPYPVSQIPYCGPPDCMDCVPVCEGDGQGPNNIGEPSTVKVSTFVCVTLP